jgi:hypothetical protein
VSTGIESVDIVYEGLDEQAGLGWRAGLSGQSISSEASRSDCYCLALPGRCRAGSQGFTVPARINILNSIKKRKNNIFDSLS